MDDSKLAASVADGNQDAFDALFRRYYGSVNNFIRSLVKQSFVTEDLTQDVFVNLWNSRHALGSVRNLNSYIYTSARNAVIDYMRRSRNIYCISTEMSEQADDELLDERYFAVEKELLIRMAVESFPERRREIFRMSRFEGMSNNEIAEQLGISKKTVENHINLATRDLRKIVGALSMLFAAMP